MKLSPPQSTSEGALWPWTHRKGRPTNTDYDHASKTKLASNQVKSKLIYSEGWKKKKNPTIPDSKSTCLSERNLGLFTYPNIISIDVSAQ